MNVKTLWAIGLLIVLVALGVYGYASYQPRSEPQVPPGTVSSGGQPTVPKDDYSELPQRRTITGFWECLPHKDRTGPQTMECAFGIAVDQSDGHYAVDTSLMSTYPVDFPTGTHVRVEGMVTPANQLSSVQKYDIDGIIRATSIQATN